VSSQDYDGLNILLGWGNSKCVENFGGETL